MEIGNMIRDKAMSKKQQKEIKCVQKMDRQEKDKEENLSAKWRTRMAFTVSHVSLEIGGIVRRGRNTIFFNKKTVINQKTESTTIISRIGIEEADESSIFFLIESNQWKESLTLHHRVFFVCLSAAFRQLTQKSRFAN